MTGTPCSHGDLDFFFCCFVSLESHQKEYRSDAYSLIWVHTKAPEPLLLRYMFPLEEAPPAPL